MKRKVVKTSTFKIIELRYSGLTATEMTSSSEEDNRGVCLASEAHSKLMALSGVFSHSCSTWCLTWPSWHTRRKTKIVKDCRFFWFERLDGMPLILSASGQQKMLVLSRMCYRRRSLTIIHWCSGCPNLDFEELHKNKHASGLWQSCCSQKTGSNFPAEIPTLVHEWSKWCCGQQPWTKDRAPNVCTAGQWTELGILGSKKQCTPH